MSDAPIDSTPASATAAANGSATTSPRTAPATRTGIASQPHQARHAASFPSQRRNLLPWLVPLIAIAAVAVLAWQALATRGPLLQIDFDRGEGIAAGDPVMYRGVRVGDVRTVHLSPDLAKVRIEARLRKDAAGLASEGSQFWIVRPEISAARVAGLDALLGPRYLECLPGSGPLTTSFQGLATAPGRTAPNSGALTIIVETPDRGSLAVDSPVIYRGIRVGAVKSLTLAGDARNVELTLAIDPAYRHLVRSNSRFWNAGGLGVDWSMKGGLSVKTPSIETVIAGGVAFATPDKPAEFATENSRFTLAAKPETDWLEWSPVLEPSR